MNVKSAYLSPLINYYQPLQQQVKLVMFLQEFEQTIHNSQKPKKARKQYSAGFKNYHPAKHHNNESVQNTEAQSDLFNQLKIGNLKELFLQTQPVVNHQKEVVEAQRISVQRLMSVPEKNPKTLTQQDDQVNCNAQNMQKFSEIYQKVANFEETANMTLLKSQFKRVQEKLKEKFSQRHKTGYFTDSIIKLVIIKHKQTQQNKITNDQLLLLYSNYLNQRTKSQEKIQRVKKSQLKSLLQRNFYLYVKFDCSKSQETEILLEDLYKLIRTDKQIEELSHDQYVLQLLHKKYTVPYESQLNKESKSTIIDLMDKKAEDRKQQKFVFNANPIPKTTYSKPKERPKSAQKVKTVFEPFHLTDHKKQQKKMEEYYKWDRNFHAREVPKTTYQAFSINKQDEAEKRRRMTELLQSSAFPSTMNYLLNYNKFLQGRQFKLKDKYSKNHQMFTTEEQIPNFQQLHKKQVACLQNKKTQNRHLTMPQPFHLSQPRPKKQKQQIDPITSPETQIKKNFKDSGPSKLQPQSTLKFEAYVNLRKKEKQQKQAKNNEKKKKNQKFEAERKIYKDILKQRIGHELHNIPKSQTNAQPLSNNVIKVNLQQIYNIEPLLIQRQSKKSKKLQIEQKKNWDPII